MGNKKYTVKDLINDASFRRMVKGIATSYEVELWSKWIEENDQNREKAKIAISEIVGFEFDDPNFPDIEQEWLELQTKTFDSKKQILNKRKKERKLKRLFLAAAAFLVMSFVGLGIYTFDGSGEVITHLEQLTEEKTISTSDDEKKTLRFSNGSKIVLGSNSSLTYSLGLLHNRTIDVTMTGEAWFEAESGQNSNQPVFAVTTPDGIVRDIGTKFLVKVNNNRSRVVLQEGFVEVELINENNPKINGVRFEVGKGEMVEFNRSDILLKEAVNSTFYTSWATGFIEFDQTKLQDFANYVEQRFGVKVQIEDPDLVNITLDGAVYFRSMEELMHSVSEVTLITVYQSEGSGIVHIAVSSKIQNSNFNL